MFQEMFRGIISTALTCAIIVSGFGWIGESGLIDQWMPSTNGHSEKVVEYWKTLKELNQGLDNIDPTDPSTQRQAEKIFDSVAGY